jgi:glycosyltransferase involved in cell wall biosynthesis
VPSEKVTTIYNPIVSDSLFLKANQRCSHEWFQPGSPPVVLAVGRLEETKDFALLIQAILQVRMSSNVRLLILGEGPARSDLDKLIVRLQLQDCVDLVGFVGNPYSFMKRAALFVSSSRREGFSNVLVEAMACGVPVVSTDCPGPREILCNGKWGTIVPIGDREALAKAIVIALKSPFLHRAQSIEHAKGFSVSRSVDSYLECLFPQKSL